MAHPHPFNPVTPDDIALANRTVLLRATAVARIAGTVVIVIGVVGLAAWLWAVVRQQQQLSQAGGVDAFGQPAPGVGFRDRIDQSIGTVNILLWATLAVGGGFALRLLGQHSLARAGGSLTGFEVGDAVPALGTEGPMATTPPGSTPETPEAPAAPTTGSDQPTAAASDEAAGTTDTGDTGETPGGEDEGGSDEEPTS